MLTKYSSSMECVKFVKNIFKSTCTDIFDQTKDFIVKNDNSSAINICDAFRSDFFDKPEHISKKSFRIIEENFGTKEFENYRISKSIYFIDLFDIISAIVSKPELVELMTRPRISTPGIYKSFFDGSFFQEKLYNTSSNMKIYISIYADEINLVCPIGIYIRLSQPGFKLFLRSIQEKSKIHEFLLSSVELSKPYSVKS